MSRYTGSIFKKSRKYNISLLENNKEFSKGNRKNQNTKPNFKKISMFAEQLNEKQKICYMYGIKEKQLRRFFKMAKSISSNIGLNLLVLLESRLDNLVYRMGFAPTRRGARQLVNHGHVFLNNRICDIPSCIVKIDDIITLKEKIKNIPLVKVNDEVVCPEFVQVDKEKKWGKYVRFPERTECHPDINEMYVVELYRRLI